MKIYLASSWRNDYQPELCLKLMDWGHEIYDFRNPRTGENGFHWSEIDPNWELWRPEDFEAALKTPLAEHGFRLDMEGLEWCDACVLLLPCGRSAHLEAGWCIGQGKPTFILSLEQNEPELMYKMATGFYYSLTELKKGLDGDSGGTV